MASAEVLRAEEKVPLKEPLEFSELAPGATSSQGGGDSGATSGDSAMHKLKAFGYKTFTSTKTFVKTSKSWLAFFDVRNLTLPKSFKDAAGNVQANWSHFRVNYIVLLTLVTVILMMFRSFYSFSVVVCLASVWAWTIWLRPNAEGSLKIFGKEYAPTEQRIILGIGSFLIVFFFSNAASAIFSAFLGSAGVVLVHGSLMKRSSDLFGDEDLEAAGGPNANSNSGNIIGSKGIQMASMFSSTLS